MDYGNEFIAKAKRLILVTICTVLAGIGLVLYGSWFGNQLLGIRALCTDTAGNVYIIANYTLYKLNRSGEILLQFGGKGSGPGRFGQGIPLDMWVDEKGTMYVADILNYRIQKFGSNGLFIAQFGKAGTEPGALGDAFELATDSEGCLYTAESTNNRIQKFSPSGELLWHIGSSQSRDFNAPHDPFVGPDGTVYICDFRKQRIQSFSGDGAFIAEYPTRPPSDNSTLGSQKDKISAFLYMLRFPQRITRDSSGNFYVLNYNSGLSIGAINKYDSGFNLIDIFDLSDKGIPFITYPAEIACTADDTILLIMHGSMSIEQIAADGTSLGSFGTEQLIAELDLLGKRKDRFQQLQLAGKLLALIGLVMSLFIYRRYKKVRDKDRIAGSLVTRID